MTDNANDNRKALAPEAGEGAHSSKIPREKCESYQDDTSEKYTLPFIKSVLVLFSLLFVLIVVVELFEKITGNKSFKFDVVNIPLFNIQIYVIKFIGTELKHFLYVLSLVIALLSSCIVYQKEQEKKQKQRKMVYEIEEALTELYKEGE